MVEKEIDRRFYVNVGTLMEDMNQGLPYPSLKYDDAENTSDLLIVVDGYRAC